MESCGAVVQGGGRECYRPPSRQRRKAPVMSEPEHEEALNGLLVRPPVVINVGLEGFARELDTCDVQVVHVDWSPPAGGDPRMAALLARLGA